MRTWWDGVRDEDLGGMEWGMRTWIRYGVRDEDLVGWSER